MAVKQALIYTALLVVIPVTSYAECETEAVNAYRAIMASGPFRYSGAYSDKSRPEQQLAGEVEPFHAHHASKGHFYVAALEEISIGKQTWLKGNTGWFQPVDFQSLVIPHSSVDTVLDWRVPPGDLFASLVWAKCLGPVEMEGKSLVGYQLQLDASIKRVFVEAATGLTVRIEYPAYDTSLNIHYDATINIRPPKVEQNAPKPPVPHGWGSTKF